MVLVKQFYHRQIPIEVQAQNNALSLITTPGQYPFPATQDPSADPNTLDDYEEGTTSPTATCTIGTMTSVSASLVYTKIGRHVSFSAVIEITDAGTGAGELRLPLPFTAAAVAGNGGGFGKEHASTGAAASVVVGSGATFATIVRYDGATIIGTGYEVHVAGFYFA